MADKKINDSVTPYMYDSDATDALLNNNDSYNDIEKAFLHHMRTVNTRGDQLDAQDRYIDYLISEQNYERSLENRDYFSENNQLARLMSSGMSRSAALAALQQGSPATSSAQLPSASNNGLDALNGSVGNFVNSVQQMAQLAQQLYSMPFDIHSKQLTNSLLSSQSYILENQRFGMDSAASFLQAVSNAQSFGADIGKLSLQEQLDYFVKQASLQPGDDGYSVSASEYGKQLIKSGSLSNPYFWSSVSNLRSNNSRSDAALYEPDRLRAMIKQMHSATTLADAQSKVYPVQVRLLNSEAFVVECTQDLQIRLAEAQTNIATIQSNAAQSITDSQVSQANYNKAYYEEMLNILPTISSATLEEYSYRLAYLETLHDPEAFESERQSIISSNTYDAVVYTKLKMIEEFKSTELNDMLSGSDPQKIQEYKDMVREGIALLDLYGADIHDDQHKWIRDIATGLGIGIGAYGLFGGKGRSPRTSYRNTSYRGNPFNVPVTPM